ncbi:RluA family pseudouridine synthase [Hydrogenovibrio kuenenii]|uniref:RluA family pseudouridine synthase n=1 Tax=Hydrogenovibrio kuenenii TaxID=63658 RepID=UPI000467EC3F|nr:RNA pseudouridine synthase [Hydrogenovibrio kuenenii]
MDTINNAQDTAPLTFTQQFTVSADITLIDALAEQTPLSKQQLKGALTKGCVWVKTDKPNAKTVRLRRAKKILAQGSEVSIYYNEAVLNTEIPKPTLIEDCTDFSVWYKPKVMLSQGSKWGDHTTLARWIESHYEFDGKSRQAIVVHRLDRATDGLMLIAHNHQAAKTLTEAFMNKQMTKIYQAGVSGYFPDNEQTFDAPLDDKPAISHVKRLDYDEKANISLVEVRIETGRKHQIRRHLSEADFPLVGDRLYGQAIAEDTSLPDLMLTAVYLQLKTDKLYEFRLPDNLNQTLKDFSTAR